MYNEDKDNNNLIEIINKFYDNKCVKCGFVDMCHKNGVKSLLSINICQDNDLFVKQVFVKKD